MPHEQSLHMTTEQFRQHGRQVVDWISDYYDRIETLPVLSQVQPGEIRAALPPAGHARIGRVAGGQDHFARCDSLAVAELLCVLPS